MKKLILFLFALSASVSSFAFTQVRQVQISTGAISRQSGSSNMQYSTITFLSAANIISTNTVSASSAAIAGGAFSNMIASGTFQRNTQTISGTATDNSTATFTAQNTFSGNNTFSAPQTFTSQASNSILIQSAASGNNPGVFVDNTSNTSSSDSRFTARTAGASGGNPLTLYTVSGMGNWATGALTSDKANLHISSGSVLGTSDFVVMRSSTTGIDLHGTNAADNAPTGFYGEYITSATATAGVTVSNSAAYLDLISTFTLSAGDWDIRAGGIWSQNGATFTSTQMELCIGTTAGNSTGGCADGQNYFYVSGAVPTSFTHEDITIPPFRVSISGSTNYFLKVYTAVFTVGNPKWRGSMSARRVR